MSLPGRWRWRDRPIFCELSIRETALATLIHQRRLTPSCGGQAPTAERTVGPARMIAESLTPKPGIREHNRHSTAGGAKASWLRPHLNELRMRCCTQANPSVHVHGRPQPRGDSMAARGGHAASDDADTRTPQ